MKRMKPDEMTPQEAKLHGKVAKGEITKLEKAMTEWLDAAFETDPLKRPPAMEMIEAIAKAAGIDLIIQNSADHLELGLEPHATDDMMMVLNEARGEVGSGFVAKPKRTIAAIIDLLERTGPKA